MRLAAVGDVHCKKTSRGAFEALFAAMAAAADEERDAGPIHQQERPPVSPAAALRLTVRARACG